MWTDLKKKCRGIGFASCLALAILVVQLETGAAGTAHFEPGGVAFWSNQRLNLAHAAS